MTMRRAQSGFTLLEAVIVIAMTGIVAAVVAVFIRAPVTGYVDQARRAELTDAADLALRRIAREVQRALPNSVRIDASGKLLEFLPVSAGGRYRAAPDASGTGDFLDFASTTDGSFEVLGPPVAVAAGDQLVVYNLGLPGADAYSGETRRVLSGSGTLSTLAFAPGGAPFPYASPSQRFQVVARPVTFFCTEGAGGTGSLRRYAGYPIQSAQPTTAAAMGGGSNALLAPYVEGCSFGYSASGARNAIVTLTLKLTAQGESVTLLHQVHLDNSP